MTRSSAADLGEDEVVKLRERRELGFLVGLGLGGIGELSRPLRRSRHGPPYSRAERRRTLGRRSVGSFQRT